MGLEAGEDRLVRIGTEKRVGEVTEGVCVEQVFVYTWVCVCVRVRAWCVCVCVCVCGPVQFRCGLIRTRVPQRPRSVLQTVTDRTQWS